MVVEDLMPRVEAFVIIGTFLCRSSDEKEM